MSNRTLDEVFTLWVFEEDAIPAPFLLVLAPTKYEMTIQGFAMPVIAVGAVLTLIDDSRYSRLLFPFLWS